MYFQQREPFAPFRCRLPAADDPDLEDVKHHIEEITQQIQNMESLLGSSGELTDQLKTSIRDKVADLVKKIDKSMEPPPKDFFKTSNGKALLEYLRKEMVGLNKQSDEVASKAHIGIRPPESTATSGGSSSSPAENGLEEVIKHEKELQERAKEEKEGNPGQIFLHLSYSDLEHQLKLCLLCFAIFPSHQVIKKRTIIYWWIGEGLVSASGDGRTAEQVGEDCFRMLIASGLIQPICQKLSRTANYCKIYPWVREMLVSKAKEEYFFNFADFPERPRPTLNNDRCKRACLSVAEGEEKKKVSIALSSEGKAHECLSLFNYNVHYLSSDHEKRQKLEENLQKLEAMTTLQLGRWQNLSFHHVEVDKDSFLDALQFLTELKYLSLHGISRITELPQSIAKLTNLLILDLRSCHNLESVTTGVTSLRSLTHLDVSGCYLLDKMPRGISSMSNLQVLKGFVVGGTRSKDPCPLGELTDLPNLWKLSIRIGSEAQVDDDLSELSRITSLRSLRITWGQVKLSQVGLTRKKSALSKSTGMESLSFPQLEKLALECVPSDESVTWLKAGGFENLERLYIEGGKLTKLSLVSGDDRWKIQILRLKFLKELKLEWTDIKKELRQLKGAQIIDCPKIGIALREFDEKGIWEGADKKQTQDPWT